MAAVGEDACGLVEQLAPTAVVLDSELPDDGAWSTCARMTEANPGLTVVLSATDDFDGAEREPRVHGAPLVKRRDGMEALAQRVLNAACAPVA